MRHSLLKEVSYYQQEVIENEDKLKEMKKQNKNPYDIKKFQEVLGESYMMIPDSKNRLEQAISDLATYVESAAVKGLLAEITDDDNNNNEWYVKAQELLKKENNTNCQTGEANKEDDTVEETDVSGLQEGEAF